MCNGRWSVVHRWLIALRVLQLRMEHWLRLSWRDCRRCHVPRLFFNRWRKDCRARRQLLPDMTGVGSWREYFGSGLVERLDLRWMPGVRVWQGTVFWGSQDRA